MKIFIILFILASQFKLSSQTFTQNFNSSTTLANYFSSTPNSNQFDNIASTGGAVTVSVSSNNLNFTRTTSNTGYFSRSTDFSPTPTGMIYKFDISVTGNSVAQSSAATFYIGSNFTSTSGVPSNAESFARLSINFIATNGTFQIKDISNNAPNLSSELNGTQSITWALNNTGATTTYNAPNNTTESIANDKADVWVGSTKIFNDVAVETSTQTMTDIKFLYSDGTGSIIIDNIEIYTATDGSLPVELKSFTAKELNGSVVLNWITATESANFGFDIERKSIKSNWEKIGFIKGSGTSSSEKYYTYKDVLSKKGKFSYRLKQIDLDGKFEYQNPVELTIGLNPNKIVLDGNYPNPFNSKTIISYQIPKSGIVDIKLYNITGKEILTIINENQNEGFHEAKFDASSLPSGVYYYKLQSNNQIEIKRMVLLK